MTSRPCPRGVITTYVYDGLAVTWSYDQDGRLTDLTVTGAGGAVQDLGHGYDASGNVSAVTDRLDAARSQAFSYDALDRLTQGTGPYGGFDYTWDAAGNRTQRVRTVGEIATTETDSYPADSNRLSTVSDGAVTRTLGYSGSGHVVSDAVSGGDALTLVYDASDRQVELKRNGLTEAGYRFDVVGRRVSKSTAATPSAARTDFVHDPAGHLLAETDGLGVPIREYVWLGDLPLTLIVDPAGAAALYWIHPDRLGSPQKMTDGGGAVVWDAGWGPFGEAFSVTAGGGAVLPLRFPGQYADAESGRRDNGRRVYDPTLGRYLQSDPIGLAGGLNRYAYVGGNPLRWTDSSGLVIDTIWDIGNLIYDIWNENWGDAAADAAAMCIPGVPAGITKIKKLGPIGDAAGPHTVWKTDAAGKIVRHETYTRNTHNPSGWDKVQSTDITGKAHYDKSTGAYIPTPHTQGSAIPGGVRPATSNEIPRR